MNKKKSKKGFVKDFTNNNLTESAPQSAEPQQSNSLLVWFRYDSNNEGRSLSARQAKHGITPIYVKIKGCPTFTYNNMKHTEGKTQKLIE